MEFTNEIEKLSKTLIERKDYVHNEEMAKQSLIIPFLQKLGYDVFDPLEIRPEYIADFGKRKGEKVDYAIFRNNEPIIFIEAKPVTEKLDNHDSQLSRYFNATPEVKIALLSNGLTYKFYTDLTKDNTMDDEPFYVLNMEKITSLDIEILGYFKKTEFDADKILSYAEELVYMSNLNTTLKELFKNPTDDFLRFLIKDFSNSRITSNVLNRFRPLVKNAINTTLLEMISEGLFPKKASTSSNEVVKEKNGVITTKGEITCYEIIKDILFESNRDTLELKYRDSMSYFTVINKGVTKWFFRIKLDSDNKYVVSRLDLDKCKELCPGFEVEKAPKQLGQSRIIIKSEEDLKKLRNLIVASFDDTIKD